MIATGVEAVEADRAGRTACAERRDDEAAEWPEKWTVERAAQRHVAERCGPEEALAQTPRRFADPDRQPEHDPVMRHRREEAHVPERDRRHHAGDGIDDEVQEDVRRRGELRIEEAAVRDRGVDALLHGGRERAEEALAGGEERERHEGDARPETAARGAEVRHELVVLDRELTGKRWRRTRLRRRRERLLDPSPRGSGGGLRRDGGRRRLRRGRGCRHRRRCCGGVLPVALRRCSRAVLPEARRRVVADRELGVQHARTIEQDLVGLRDVGVRHAAIDGTDGGARLLVVEADALGALLRDDVEDVVRQRRMHRAVRRLPLDAALVDGGVRALGLAGPAVDAFTGDHRRHRGSSSSEPASRLRRMCHAALADRVGSRATQCLTCPPAGVKPRVAAERPRAQTEPAAALPRASGVDAAEFMVTHRDINVQFPIERLRKLAADKVIATVASEHVGFRGRTPAVRWSFGVDRVLVYRPS